MTAKKFAICFLFGVMALACVPGKSQAQEIVGRDMFGNLIVADVTNDVFFQPAFAGYGRSGYADFGYQRGYGSYVNYGFQPRFETVVFRGEVRRPVRFERRVEFREVRRPERRVERTRNVERHRSRGRR